MELSELQLVKNKYGIVGNSEQLNRALDVALKVAPVDLSVLIVGESGVGKEVIPRLIHDNSSRKHNRYMAINCGSVPEGLIDDELFGHVKGAFTGATENRDGYFATVNGGTLFLDEVGELPPATQVRLLRVLETGEYLRLGSSEVCKTDVRVVAATNVNMKQAIIDGRFREDLYFRLNTIPINMPPLRDRGDDVLQLFRKFAFDISEKYRMPRIVLSQDAESLMRGYKWPGNIRELRNLTHRLSILETEREITYDVLSRYITVTSDSETALAPMEFASSQHGQQATNSQHMLFQMLMAMRKEIEDMKQHGAVSSVNHFPANDAIPTGNASITVSAYPEHMSNLPSVPSGGIATVVHTPELAYEPRTLQEIEREAIERALQHNKGRRRGTAVELGISERTLYRKIEEYGLE